MKKLFTLLIAALIFGCSESPSETKRDDLDNTNNNDTSNRVVLDSLSVVDSLRGR